MGEGVVPNRKIAILIRSLDVGGAERQVAQLARALAQAGTPIIVITFYPDGVFYRALAESGVRVISLSKGGRWDVFGFALRLWRVIADENPAVLYSHLNVPNVLAALMVPFRPGMRVVWALLVSEMPPRAYGRVSALFHHLETRLAAVPHAMISNSARGRDDAIRRGFRPDRIMVIPNGADTVAFDIDPAARRAVRAEWGVDDDENLVGMVARVDPMKGHAMFLDAAARMARAGAADRFAIVGGAPDDALRGYAKSLGIVDRMIWAGERDDMARIYNAFDVFCLPSEYGEGMPNVVTEAMACGVPCVVTDVGDAAVVVGDTGCVVERGDAAAMADRCARILAMPAEARMALGERARTRVVEQFGLSRVAERMAAVLGMFAEPDPPPIEAPRPT